MPKYMTHWILAEKACRHLDDRSALKPIIRSWKHTYLAGAVLPDAPFYVIWGNDGRVMNHIAEALHDSRSNSYDIFENLSASFGQAMPEAVIALMMGIISHIHVDAAFHPAICYLSGLDVSPTGYSSASATRHHLLETYLDLYLQRGAVVPYRGGVAACLKVLELKTEVFWSMLETLFSVQGRSGRRRIRKALRLNGLFQYLFDKKLPSRILGYLNRMPWVDLSLFSAHFYPYPRPNPNRLFQHPLQCRHPVTDEPFLFSVDAVAGRAVQNTLKVFHVMDKAYQRRKSVAGILSGVTGPNLYTGLTNFGKTDMHVFDISRNIVDVVCGRCAP